MSHSPLSVKGLKFSLFTLLISYFICFIQFDVFFAECNNPIETVQNTSTGLLDAMNNFKRACSRAGVTSSAKASLEECIDGLKQLIRTDDDEDALEVSLDSL